MGDLNRPHCDYRALSPVSLCSVTSSGIVDPIGNVARLLPSLEVGAVSQATSPGPNPDPLYPLRVRPYATRSTMHDRSETLRRRRSLRSGLLQRIVPDRGVTTPRWSRSLECPTCSFRRRAQGAASRISHRITMVIRMQLREPQLQNHIREQTPRAPAGSHGGGGGAERVIKPSPLYPPPEPPSRIPSPLMVTGRRESLITRGDPAARYSI